MSIRPSSNKGRTAPPVLVGLFIAFLLIAFFLLKPTGPPRTPSSGPGAPPSVSDSVPAPPRNPIQDALTPRAPVAPVDGIGIAILVDTSGSMADLVPDADRGKSPKIEIARRSVLKLLDQCRQAAADNPARNIRVGIFEFSARERAAHCRTVLPIGPLNLPAAQAAVRTMLPQGATPIGDALIVAKKALDASGLTRQHVIVLTDGENNSGYAPADVTGVISRLPQENRASVYFVAFDVAAAKFNPVRDAGGLVLAAGNENELQQNFDYILTGKILAEQPASPAPAP